MNRLTYNKLKGYAEGLRQIANDMDTGKTSLFYAMCNIDDMGTSMLETIKEDYDATINNRIWNEYSEIIALLPEHISIGEMLALKEAVQNWRDEHGYPNP